ncbi:hypothetical protein [Tropicibacter sp. S64]|uniref:hypothetical protein n=1 Tax=Tropicibacter sp. S64 TaxID=3415122 RepID=UPI003C79DE0A
MNHATDDSAAALAAEVDRLLATERFGKSSALSELLVFLRDRYPDRHRDPTTEYVIAQDLLGRGGAFDPKTDTVVRVRMRRLRDALAEVYGENPKGDCLSIPNRNYDLELIRGARQKGWLHRARVLRGCSAALALAATGGILYAVYTSLFTPNVVQYPLIKILPVQNLTGEPKLDIFEEGLQRQLGSDLQKFGRYRVFISSPPERETDEEDFTLRGSILQLDDDADIAFRLERGADNAVVYGARFKGQMLGTNYYEEISAISREIAGQIGGQGGPVVRDISATETTAPAIMGLSGLSGVDVDVFRCIVLKDMFFDTYEPDRIIKAYRCFERILAQVGDDPIALSSWGTVVMHTVPGFNLMETAGLPADMLWEPEGALELATNIAQVYPNSPDALLLLGSVQSLTDQPERAEISLRHAIDLNPGDATAHAVLAYMQLTREQYEQAILSGEEALRLSAEPQGYIYFPIAIASLVLGREAQAERALAQYIAKRSGPGADVMQLLLARLENNRPVIDHLAPKVAAMSEPLVGYSQFLRGAATRAALQRYLPEVDFGAQ